MKITITESKSHNGKSLGRSVEIVIPPGERPGSIDPRKLARRLQDELADSPFTSTATTEG